MDRIAPVRKDNTVQLSLFSLINANDSSEAAGGDLRAVSDRGHKSKATHVMGL